MIQAFYTGVSGISAHQTAIDVTADNLANIDTVGFRSYTPEFGALFDEAISTHNPSSSVNSSVGIGSSINATALNLQQGPIALSERSTDLAIEGEGWFGVTDNQNIYYTRAGDFSFDVDGDLVNSEGMYVLGTLGDNIDFTTNTLTKKLDNIALGDVAKQQKIQLPDTLTYQTEPTTNISFSGNIGTEDVPRVISAEAIDANGEKNKVQLTFTKAPNQPEIGSLWNIEAVVTSADEKTTYSTTTAQVSFDKSGALTNTTLTTVDNNGNPVSIDLGEKFSGITSIATAPISGSSKSDGAIAGELTGYDINANGEVVAAFSNGEQSSVAQIALYHFQNDQGLENLGGILFKESSNSGKPIFYQDTEGNNILGSSVMNGALESSNLPIETGLTNLIILQRAYDANAKSITTADQMIQKALQMDA